MKYTKEQAQFFMAQALQLSQNALPECRPNPPVGCVLVKDGVVVAQGWTQAPGFHHAEAMALHDDKILNQGSLEDFSAFVTLEPCSFVGRTPSCAQTLVERKIGEVYVALLDPHPKNQGLGIKILENAHISVCIGVYEDIVKEFLDPYLIRN